MKIKRSELKQLTLQKCGDDSIDSQNKVMLKIATARCARLSYMTFDGEIDYEKDIALHDQLLTSKHFSPFEHCARAMTPVEYKTFIKGSIVSEELEEIYDESDLERSLYMNWYLNQHMAIDYGWCNNFRGWIPYRYLVDEK